MNFRTLSESLHVLSNQMCCLVTLMVNYNAHYCPYDDKRILGFESCIRKKFYRVIIEFMTLQNLM